jgi:hypothetical protein
MEQFCSLCQLLTKDSRQEGPGERGASGVAKIILLSARGLFCKAGALNSEQFQFHNVREQSNFQLVQTNLVGTAVKGKERPLLTRGSRVSAFKVHVSLVQVWE